MSDTDQAPPAPVQRRFPISKEAFICFLAFLIVAAWLASMYLKLQPDQTLTNVVMIVIGYFFGSSTSSRAKDGTINVLADGGKQ